MKYFKKLIGERIYLSPRRVEDFEIFTKWMNDFNVTDYIRGSSKIMTLEAEKEYINSYGDRCYGELKLETPTYRTNPELLRQQVISSSINPKPALQDTEEHHLTNRYAKKARLGIKNREI